MNYQEDLEPRNVLTRTQGWIYGVQGGAIFQDKANNY